MQSPRHVISKSQSAFLDLSRGVAAQLVLIGHVASVSGFNLRVTIQDFGVLVFFILSGFLVTTTALRKERFSEYFIDRFSRLFTAYVPCVLFIFFAGLILKLEGPYDIATLLANLLMLQDFPLPHFGLEIFDRVGTGRQLWSVSMEWWMYMGFGAMFFVGRVPLLAMPLVAAGIYVCINHASGGVLTWIWATGALAAVTIDRLPKSEWYAFAALFAVLSMSCYSIAAGSFYDLKLGLAIACGFFCIYKAIEDYLIPDWISKVCSAIASYSFTLYLTHYTVMVTLADLQGWQRVCITILVANVIAIAMYFPFEKQHKKVANWMKARL